MVQKMRFYAPAIAWGIFVFTLSVWPGKDFPKIPSLWDLLTADKIVHVLFYGILTALILRGGYSQPTSTARILLVSTGAALYGWLLEWIQMTFCADRLFEVMDGVANTIGAFAVGIYFIFKK